MALASRTPRAHNPARKAVTLAALAFALALPATGAAASWTNSAGPDASWTNGSAPKASWTNDRGAPTASWTNVRAPKASWTNHAAPARSASR